MSINHPLYHIPKINSYSFLHQDLGDRFSDAFIALIGEYRDGDESAEEIGKLGILDFLLLGIPLLRIPLNQLSKSDYKFFKIISPIFNALFFITKLVLSIGLISMFSPLIFAIHFVIKKIKKIKDFKAYDTECSDFEPKETAPSEPTMEFISESPVLPQWFHELNSRSDYTGAEYQWGRKNSSVG